MPRTSRGIWAQEGVGLPGRTGNKELSDDLTCSFLSGLAMRRYLCRCNLVHTGAKALLLQPRQCFNGGGLSRGDALMT